MTSLIFWLIFIQLNILAFAGILTGISVYTALRGNAKAPAYCQSRRACNRAGSHAARQF